jgi:uncharacterized damage-inducible protein DinB
VDEPSPGGQARKADLLELMVCAYDVRAAWIAGLTEEAKAAPRGDVGWGAKATLAHMARWNLALLTALELKASGEPVPYQWEDMHGENARLLPESAVRTWAEVSAEAEHVYHALRDWVERLSEEQLAAIDDYAWQEGWPLWQTFLGNTYFHYLDHLAGVYMESGEAEQAATLRVQADEVYRTLDLHWD